MPAYDNLPWIPSAQQFLQTLLEAKDAGLKKAQLLQNEPRGGGGIRIAGGPDLLEQAQTERIKTETEMAKQKQAGFEAATALNEDLMRRGASAKESFERSGLGAYGVKPPEDDIQVANMGQGGIWAIDKSTGKSKPLVPGTPAAAKEPTARVPIYPPGTNPATAGILGIAPTWISGPLSAMQRYMQGGTNSASTNSISAPSGNRYIIK